MLYLLRVENLVGSSEVVVDIVFPCLQFVRIAYLPLMQVVYFVVVGTCNLVIELSQLSSSFVFKNTQSNNGSYFIDVTTLS